MGNKNTGKREEKKEPQLKPKVIPGRKRENFSQTATTIVNEAPKD
jgi:hypothetical protein